VACQQPVGWQLRGREHLVRPRQAQVAQQHRCAHAEALGVAEPGLAAVQAGEAAMDGRLPAAGVAAVHHVVVDQRARLEQLERGGGGDDSVAVVAARTAKAPVAERRTQPLATGDEVGESVGERSELDADGVQRGQLTGDELTERLLHALPEVLAVERAGAHGRADYDVPAGLQGRGYPSGRGSPDDQADARDRQPVVLLRVLPAEVRRG